MNNEEKILKHLLEHKQQSFTINQIAKILKINYRIAFEGTKKLGKEGLIRIIKAGNANHCSFGSNFSEKLFAVEYMRRNEILKNNNFKILYKRLAKISQQFIILLFGSYAKKTQTRHSDIDLLLISDNDKKIKEELNLLPLDIHVTSVTYEDFITMLKTREQTVVSEAMKRNVILFGIEDYYRLLQNAG